MSIAFSARRLILPAALVAAIIGGGTAWMGADSLYKVVPGWGQLPNGMKWGETPGMAIDSKGTIFAFTRAEPPVIELNAAGKVLRTWGDKMFVWPHGIRVDRFGFLWLTDGRDAGGNGQMVYKYSPDRKLVMTIGTKGVAGDGPYTFNDPNGVAISADGTHVYVAVTRANAVWRLMRTSPEQPPMAGTYLQLSGGLGPDGIAVSLRGELAVAHAQNGSVWLFDHLGDPIGRIRTPGGLWTTSVRFAGTGDRSLLIVDAQTGSIFEWDLH